MSRALLIASLAAATLLSSCGNEAVLVGEVEGCRVWRVSDGMAYVYLTHCPKGVTGNQHDPSCGENPNTREQLTLGGETNYSRQFGAP